MARTGITYAQVAEAAEELKAKGIEPTMVLIRDSLGTGGFSTISTHLANWRTQQTVKPAQKPMTQEVEDAALKAIKQIWYIATEEAQQEVTRINQEFDQYKLQVKRDFEERDQAIKEMDGMLAKQENDLVELGRNVKTLELANANSAGKIQQLAELNNKLQETIKQLEARLVDKKTAQPPAAKAQRGNKPA